LKVLHLKGTSYERGYQHGVLLAEEIEEALSSGITMFALMIGQEMAAPEEDQYQAGLKELIRGKEAMEQFIPPEHRQEMAGIADGLRDQGSDLTYDDIVLWNTANDCLMLNYSKLEDTDRPGKRHAYPELGCCTISAYGEATQDGAMIVGKNMDWSTTPEMRNNPIVMVADPSDGGYGYLAPIYPGWITSIEGMNEKGIVVGLEVVPADSETMHGLGWHFHTNLILKYADSIEDAINIITVYPRTCGDIHQVADAKTHRAVVIEYTKDAVGLIYPEKGRDVLWSTNHFNAYPGWQGYKGPNMVALQTKRMSGLADISSIDAWQMSLELIHKGEAGRYGRIRQLLDQWYGEMTVEKMIKIVSDRYDMDTGRVIGWDDYGTCVSQMWAKDFELSKDVQYYKSEKRGPLYSCGANIWSLVMVPLAGDLRIAMSGPVPGQKGPFRYLNLHEELERGQ
ncbi:MAG: hypothetical protein JRC92_07220, partial [Deltaproteobacteria bacterium]|nr:hypothetical protein [Deltaproteobacteria bacterium]